MKKNLRLPLLLSAFLFIKPGIIKAQVNVQDSLALVDLYNSTDGPHWTNNNNWLTTKPLYIWYGIGIYNNRVNSLDLSNNNLSGTLPASLNNLTNIYAYRLDNNHLIGSIPDLSSNTFSLQQLYLNDNNLSGGIPENLGATGDIRIIQLQNNNLTGEIPSSMLRNAGTVNASNNQLSGNLPSFGFIGSLTYLSLSNNKFTGSIPDAFGDIYGLLDLYLDHNNFTGTIPPHLSASHSLQNLDLSYNKLTVTILAELANMYLTRLYLGHNMLTGRFPAQLASPDSTHSGNSYYIKVLSVEYNQLTGKLPPFKLKVCATLNLSNNEFKDIIPVSLGSVTTLQRLDMSNNKLEGVIPSSFANLSNLKYLNLNNNKMVGPVPEFFSSLQQLTSLNLLNNYFTFDGIEYLAEQNFVFNYDHQKRTSLHLTNNNKLSVYAGGTLTNNRYKWFRNGNLVATIFGDSTYIPIQSGIYNVQVTNSIAKALILRSDAVTFTAVKTVEQHNIAAVKSNNKSNFSIYPNPAKTTATIAFNATGKYTLKLTDISGTVLQTKTGTGVNDKNILQLDVSKYAAGVYFVIISNGQNEMQTLRLTKE